MSNISITAVKPAIINIIWGTIEHHIQAAIDESNGELDIDNIKRRAMNSEVLIVIVRDGDDILAALAAETRSFDTGKKVFHIMTAGGERMVDWLPDIDEAFSKIAKGLGCNEIYIIGRPGWTRAVKKIGYELVHTTLCKRI